MAETPLQRLAEDGRQAREGSVRVGPEEVALPGRRLHGQGQGEMGEDVLDRSGVAPVGGDRGDAGAASTAQSEVGRPVMPPSRPLSGRRTRATRPAASRSTQAVPRRCGRSAFFVFSG